MKKLVIIVLIAGLALTGLTGCVTTPTQQHYETSALLGTVGAGVGALVDKDNRWRGAVIGGTVGALTGYGLASISQEQIARDAAYRGTVIYREDPRTGEWLRAEPVSRGPDGALVKITRGRGGQVYGETYQRVPW